MTFEEFFQKKKIDLKALASERPALFEEFKAHFQQMGEKSFDHTKKYWFNKLRRSYPLPVQETPVRTAAARTTTPAATASATDAPRAAAASKPTGFKPRFKAGKTGVTPPPETKPEAPAPESDKPASKPTGFKPRFKAGKTGVTPPPEMKPEAPAPESDKPVSKPTGFKPRFKAGTTPPAKKSDGE